MKVHMLHSNSFDYVTKNEAVTKLSQEKDIGDILIRGFNDLFCRSKTENFNHLITSGIFPIH